MAQARSNRRIPGRSFFLIVVCFVLWFIIIGRLFQLQILNYDYYQQRVIDNVQRTTTLSAERGIIYDCNMVPLATNYTVWRIFISPRDIADNAQAELISSNLSQILGVDYTKIYNMTQKTWRADETVKRNVDEEEANDVRRFITEYGLETQIHLEAGSARYYPFGSTAANVIGVVGVDGGLIGLELQYNSFLTGVSGKYVSAKNASGLNMPYKYDSYIDASNGANLVTTLNLTMQNALIKQLKQTYEDSDPLNRVTGIIMDVKTGAVRAMGVYPDFDLNDPYTLDADSQKKLDECGYAPGSTEYNSYYTELLYKMWKNKAVSELYEPGSTFKIITSAAALEENVVKLDDHFNCTSAGIRVSGYDIHCHRIYGHGTVTFERGLQQSCNPTLMQVAFRLGREVFYNYFEAFGYTEKTGIDLPGEASTIYHPYNSFYDIQLAVYSFGQTFKVTALQQLTAICAVANGGYLVTPYVVEQIVDDDGNVLMQHETDVKRQVVSEAVCTELTGVLERGVSGDGGAKNAYVAGYKIAAKTGTSQVQDILNEEGVSYLRVGSTVAYAPADDPQIAMIIVVDQPQCNPLYGSVVAAPYIANLMNEILPTLGVERSYTEAELEKLAVTVKKYVGWPTADATLDIGNRLIKYEVRGNGDIVTYQIPEAGESLNRNEGKIILYTGDATPTADITVPSVIGMTASLANKTLADKGLNIIIEGATQNAPGTSAYVYSQYPSEGTLVSYGSVVTITLRYLDGTAN